MDHEKKNEFPVARQLVPQVLVAFMFKGRRIAQCFYSFVPSNQ